MRHSLAIAARTRQLWLASPLGRARPSCPTPSATRIATALRGAVTRERGEHLATGRRCTQNRSAPQRAHASRPVQRRAMPSPSGAPRARVGRAEHRDAARADQPGEVADAGIVAEVARARAQDRGDAVERLAARRRRRAAIAVRALDLGGTAERRSRCRRRAARRARPRPCPPSSCAALPLPGWMTSTSVAERVPRARARRPRRAASARTRQRLDARRRRRGSAR